MTLRDKLKFWILLSNYIQIVVRGTSPLSLPNALDDKLLDLKAFGDCETRNLPEGYQELEYIEGHNNEQYINTGIVPTSSMEMYGKFQFVSVDASTPTQVAFFMGARDVGAISGVFFQEASMTTSLDFFQAGTRWATSHTRAVNDIVELKVKNALAEVFINGSSIGTNQFTPNETTQYPIFLNALNNIGQPFNSNVNVVNRICRFTIAGICDMRPARRLSDGVLGMYDTIRKRFFTNAGTGEFVAGTPLNALPDGYTQLEYLQSTGTQYIDTGIKFSSYPFKKVIIFSDAVQGSGAASLPNWVNGSWANDSNNRSGGIGLKSNSKIGLGIGTTGLGGSPYEIDNPTTPTTVTIEVLSSTSAKFTGGSTDYNSITYSGGALSGYTDYLFGAHFNGATSTWAAGVKIYGAKYYDNNVLVREFIPAKRNSDGVLGMYDMVSGTFFTNAGTGTFTAGNVITPSPTKPADIWCNNGAIKAIRPIKYLESTGTQYIDTGFKPSGNNIRVRTKLQVLDTTNANIFFGEYKVNEQIRSHPFNGNYFFGYATGSNNTIAGNPTVAVKSGDVVEYDWTNNTVKFNCNGTDYNYTLPGTVITSDLSIWLFSLNTGNGQNDYSTRARMYYFQVYDNGILVRDMIPALDANNIPCMFDKVEGKCYYNAGTGQFIAGYLPAEYEELEYIQGYCSDSSDSTIKASYIDTGIILPANANFYLKSQLASSPTTNSYLMCGTRTAVYAGSEIYVGSANTVIDWYGSAESDRLTIGVGGSTGDIYEIYGNNKTLTVFKNGSSIGYKTFNSPTTPTLTFWLNSRNTNNQVTSQTAPTLGRIYRFTVAGVCDMIPARKRSNGHIGMYDLVRRQFFENAGEGQFTMGKLPILPDGYTQLEYLESTGTQYIDTGVVPNQDTSVELDGSIDGYGIFFGVRTAALVDISTIQGTSTGFWAMGYNTSADAFGTKDSNRHVWFKNKNLQYMDGVLKQNYTYANFTAMGNAYLFAYNNNGTVGYVINGRVRIYSCKIWATADSMLVRYMIPAKRNSDGVVGMYDIMNDVFLTNQGTGDFEYGSEIPDSRETYYYVDGVVEKVGTRSAGNKNIFNGVFEQGGLYQGNLVVADTRIRTPDYLTFPAGTYTISCASAYEVWIEKNDASSVNWYSSYTFTASSTSKFKVAVRSKTDPSTTAIRPDAPVKVQIEAGSTATAYVPYCDGGLAVCENLLGIGSTQDVQEILTGEVTRNVGVFVLTGEEWWEKLNFAGKSVFRAKAVIPDDRYSNPENNIGLCSHFTVIPTSAGVTSAMNNLELAWNTNSLMCIRYDSMATLNDFLAFLRSQYDAGTPVTIVYPLATDSTELVAGQTLTLSAGNNTAEILQASIDGLSLEVKYIKEM